MVGYRKRFPYWARRRRYVYGTWGPVERQADGQRIRRYVAGPEYEQQRINKTLASSANKAIYSAREYEFLRVGLNGKLIRGSVVMADLRALFAIRQKAEKRIRRFRRLCDLLGRDGESLAGYVALRHGMNNFPVGIYENEPGVLNGHHEGSTANLGPEA